MNEIIDTQRKIIDKVDKSIIDLLRERFDASVEIGRQKRLLGAVVLDTSREVAVLDDRSDYAAQTGVNPEFVRKIIQMIMDESKTIQSEVSA